MPDVIAGQALERVLECGLRVVIARDRTLPVASVILAVESGPEDDPEDYPGLVHALAYHLLQGNRELRPGESVATVHGGGGVSTLAVGLAQVRFESLLPASRLEEVLWIESQRLRFPTISEALWKKTLGWASRDPRRLAILPASALAAVHRAPSLAHNDRLPGPTLASMSEAALASQLRTRFNYARATLVVVAPNEPREVIAMIEPLFADLPATQRKVPSRLPGVRSVMSPESAAPPADPGAEPSRSPSSSPAPSPSPSADPSSTSPEVDPSSPPEVTPPTPEAEVEVVADPGDATIPAAPPSSDLDPEVVPLGPHKLPIYAWSVPGEPAANAWATAFCRTLNRQRRGREDPKGLRVSCAIDSDPRRTAVLIQVAGAEEPLVTLRERFARLQSGRDRALLRSQARALADELRFAGHRPLGLARQLAITAEPDGATAQAVTEIDARTGAATLADTDNLAKVFPGMLELKDAIVLVRPDKPTGKGKAIRPPSGGSKPIPKSGGAE